jgi:hypothetical protein
LLEFENNIKTDIKKRAISMAKWLKVAPVKCPTEGLADSELHPELLYHSLSRLTVFDENYKYGNLMEHLLLKVNN